MRGFVFKFFAVFLALFAFPIIAFHHVSLPDRLSFSNSKIFSYQDEKPAYVFLSEDDKWRIGLKLRDVDPLYLKALLRFEDKRFYSHLGFDPLAAFRSAFLNLKNFKVISGASTITMQLVRVLEPRPRTLFSKGVEILRAMQLEYHFSKDEILELYLNFIPFGKNIEGLKAAALSYFGHGIKELSEDEISILLAVPQRPSKYFPSKENSSALMKRAIKINERLKSEGLFSGRDSISSKSVPSSLKSFPKNIPHLANHWKKETKTNSFISTIDENIQAKTLAIIRRHQKAINEKAVFNIAALVIENETGDLKAAVGGFDYFNQGDGQQIPAFMQARSSGSTLKPVIFASAIEHAITLPGQLIEDIPIDYGGYIPKNFDGSYSGLVRLDYSLKSSLNVPFIRLLKEIGIDRFLAELKYMGVKSLEKKEDYYGLSAAIGGIELSPMELASIYLSFANSGLSKTISYGQKNADLLGAKSNAKQSSGLRVYSPETIYLLKKVLSLRDRPDFPEKRKLNSKLKKIYWKTGTSFGHRDAWTAGFDENYTVVVWTGNLNNQGVKSLVGSKMAAPVFFDLIEDLAKVNEQLKLSNNLDPGKIGLVSVCSFSGQLPSSACEKTQQIEARLDKLPLSKCPFHISLELDRKTDKALAPGCRHGKETYHKSFLNFSSEVSFWLKRQGRMIPRLPDLDNSCKGTAITKKFEVSSPKKKHTYFLIDGIDPEKQELRFKALYQGESKISWFINGKFLGSKPGDEILWWTPKPGRHTLVAEDESGLSRQVDFEVLARSAY